MKIIAISDLHGYLPTIEEQADIMLIAGDISPLDIQFNKPAMKNWLLTQFSYWIINLPVKEVFLVAGNHDSVFEGISKTFLTELYLNTNYKLHYLKNEEFYYTDEEGIEWKIFGTPYCHIFGNWPFMRSEEVLEEKFKKIPENVDIIISHDPPYGIGAHDCVLQYPSRANEHIGNVPLRNQLEKTNFKLLCCGHIHSGDHNPSKFMNGEVVNVSINDEHYESTYPPFYTTLNKDY